MNTAIPDRLSIDARTARCASMLALTGPVCPDGASVADSQPLDAVDEVAAEELRLADDLEGGQAVEHLVEDRPQLDTGQTGAETEVRAAATERDVGVRVARDVEAVGVREHRVVPVGGVVEEHDLLAGRDVLATDLGVLARGPLEGEHRGAPAQELLDGRIDAVLEV